MCSNCCWAVALLQEIAEAGMIPHVLAKANHRSIPTYALCTTALINFTLLSVFALLFGIGKLF
jgi:amino acid transporter